MEINVLYSSDNGYISVVGISIISLLENNKDVEQITIYMIDCGISSESIELLVNIVNDYGRQIVFRKLEEIIEIKKINAPKVSYYGRLFAPYLTDASKILYLDCDMIIAGSLRTLWEIDVTDYGIAAVQGPGISKENRQKLEFPEEFRYINSGMLLMNLDFWREKQWTSKLIDYLNEKGEIPPYHDQNIINAICYRNILIIEPKYNLLWSMMACKPKEMMRLNNIVHYYSEQEIKEAIKNPIIIHFSNSIYGRPWQKGCNHKYRKVYMKYRNISPWKDEPLESKKINGFRKFRNLLYVCLPSKLYYFAQKMERFMIREVLPKLPMKKTNSWIEKYMNGQ